MSWAGKILRVDLTAGTCKSEPLNMDWAKQYLGQRGLATKYFVEEVDAKVDPLSPDNKVIWATGPLTGTMASTGGRYSVVTKGPLTGAIACSNSGGYWGAELKMAGWDMIIFEGKSPKPVYLSIVDDVAELHDAGHLWGKTVFETEETLKKASQDPQTRVSSIGRAGENQVLFAAVVNDLHRAAGRSGVGAVAGSKNLKAVTVRGTLGVGNVHDPKAFMKVTAEEAMAEKRPTDGKSQLVTNQACFGCTIACGRISKIDETHFSVVNKPEYWGATGGLEYEAAWALGAATGVDDIEALQYANTICNEDGMDPISFGATVGAVMELYESGVINKDQVGLEANFGSAEALVGLVEMTARGEGYGKELGQGSKRLCEKVGKGELSMSVKGQEFPAYDARGIQGMGLTYATSNRGACHLRSYTVSSEIMGVPVKTDPLVTEGKPDLVKAFQDATAAVDSSGLCVFTTFAWTLTDIAPQIAAACGDEFSEENVALIGERIWNMERDFNNRAGFTRKDDDLPPRLKTEPAQAGPAKGLTSGIDKMIPEYYEVRGWDSDGQLKADTRSRLGL